MTGQPQTVEDYILEHDQDFFRFDLFDNDSGEAALGDSFWNLETVHANIDPSDVIEEINATRTSPVHFIIFTDDGWIIEHIPTTQEHTA